MRKPIALTAGSSLVECVCVPPDKVKALWPVVGAFIQSAMERGRLTDVEAVTAALDKGALLLWVAWDGFAIQAAAVTELSQVNGERFCTIVACGGKDRHQWMPLLADLEQYARAESCKAMRIMGRKGWVRVLKDYSVTRVILEKELS